MTHGSGDGSRGPGRGVRRALDRGVRTVVRGVRAVWQALEVVDLLVLLYRITTAPFRLVLRALDGLW